MEGEVMDITVTMHKQDAKITKRIIDSLDIVAKVAITDDDKHYATVTVTLDEQNLQFPAAFVALILRATELDI
jgi:hypothetical protein